MRGSERRQIAALRRAVDGIQASRVPVPAHMASEYQAAVGSLQDWEDQAENEQELGVFPWVAIAGRWAFRMGITAMAYIIGRTAYETGSLPGAFTAPMKAVAPWIVYGLTGVMFYNLGTKGKFL